MIMRPERFRPVAVALGALALTAPVASAQMPPALVEIAEVRFEQLAPTIRLPGTVISLDDSRVSANVAGTVVEVVEVGDRVTAGQPLAQLDRVNLELARAENENLVARETSRIEFLQSEVKRLEALAAQNNAARSLLEQTQSDLAVARSDRRAARARLQRIEVDLDRTAVKAPFDGVVTERFVNPGEAVALGAAVARLVGEERLEITARAPVRSVHYIEPGAVLSVSNPFADTTGVLRTKVPTGDVRSHMFELRIEVVDNPFEVNEDVRVEVPTAPSEAFLVVPRDALVLRREQTIVYRVGEDMAAQAVTVTPGAARGDHISVEGDLQPGDRVIIRGAERLRPGQQVQLAAADGLPQGQAPGAN